MSGATVSVEMGETRVARGAGERLVAHGLGACVCLCLYDTVARLAAMVHIVLPETVPIKPSGPSAQSHTPPPGRCADTAVRHVIAQMVEMGARLDRLQAAIAGGSQIFSHATGADKASPTLSRLEIGPRNVQAVRAALTTARVPLVAQDVGGSSGRNVTFCVGNGDVHVRRIGADEKLLATIGVAAPTPVLRREEALHAGH
jgi:chemotaxis protein CheD